MSVVDVEYNEYKCPHCNGTIQLQLQYGVGENYGAVSYSIYHITKINGEIEITGLPIEQPKSDNENIGGVR